MHRIHLNADDYLDLDEFETTGFRCGIFGSSGAGKGYTLGRITEDVIEIGYPVIMLDPEEELWTFREVGAVVVGGKHGDAPFVDSDAGIDDAIRFGLDSATPIVFDVQHLAVESEAEAARVGEHVMRRLWRILDDERRRAFFVCTEAAIFAPQQVPRSSHRPEMMRQFLQRGRKRGLHSIIETQRSADIQKSVISQCRVQLIGYLDEPVDYDAVKRKLAGRSFEHMRALPQGTFYSTYHDREVAIGPRKVTHGGGTPPEGEEITIRPTRRRRNVAGLIESLTRKSAEAAPVDAPPPPPAESDPGTGKRHLSHHVATVPLLEWNRAKHAVARVAELEDQLATAQRERDSWVTVEQWNETKQEAARLADELMTAERRAEQAEQSAQAWREDAERLDRLRNALADALQGAEPMTAQIVMPDGTTAETFHTGSVTEARVLELIRAHGNGSAPVLQPVEALRARFLETAAERLVEKVRGLDDDQREALLFLLSDVKYRAVTAVAVALSGNNAGSTITRWRNALQGLASIGLVEKGGQGGSQYRARVEEWVRSELSAHDPSDDDIASVRDRALSLVMS